MKTSELRKILESMRVLIPKEVEKELVEHYGNCATDDEGHDFKYTEQDICEQLLTHLQADQN